MSLNGKIIKERFYGTRSAATACSRKRAVFTDKFRGKRLILIELFYADRFDKVQIDVRDVDLFKGDVAVYKTPPQLEIAEQDLQIGVLGHDRSVRVSAHSRVILQKLHEDIGNVVDLIKIHGELLTLVKNFTMKLFDFFVKKKK